MMCQAIALRQQYMLAYRTSPCGQRVQSASAEQLAEVPTSYRPSVGVGKLDTWRDGRAIISAAFKLA